MPEKELKEEAVKTGKEAGKSKDQRIKAEKTKLMRIFKNMEGERKKSADSLISNAAFMAVILQDLQKEINDKGTTEKYQNGANQYGIKKSSSVEIYNVMIKNYSQIMKQLYDLLPEAKVGDEEDDEFMRFVNSNPRFKKN